MLLGLSVGLSEFGLVKVKMNFIVGVCMNARTMFVGMNG